MMNFIYFVKIGQPKWPQTAILFYITKHVIFWGAYSIIDKILRFIACSEGANERIPKVLQSNLSVLMQIWVNMAKWGWRDQKNKYFKWGNMVQ